MGFLIDVIVRDDRIAEDYKMPEIRAPVPPFTHESAVQKVRAAEDGWNSCDPNRVSLAYTVDSYWRNRVEFVLTVFGEPQIHNRRK